MKRLNIIVSILIAFFIMACKDGPKIISTPIDNGVDDAQLSAKSIFHGSDTGNDDTKVLSKNEEISIVSALETMTTDRYVYVRVQQGEEEYWVATAKKEIEVGKTYFFKKGLLQTNFKSKEFNRPFDTLYLVSNMVLANHGGSVINNGDELDSSPEPQISIGEKIQVEGSIAIAEIVENREKYKNKKVQISGKCTKGNYNIMGRNWIHLKDGSKDDFDLIITTEDHVEVGQTVTMSGTVHLGVDFGAGYAYDIIIEEGKILKQN